MRHYHNPKRELKWSYFEHSFYFKSMQNSRLWRRKFNSCENLECWVELISKSFWIWIRNETNNKYSRRIKCLCGKIFHKFASQIAVWSSIAKRLKLPRVNEKCWNIKHFPMMLNVQINFMLQQQFPSVRRIRMSSLEGHKTFNSEKLNKLPKTESREMGLFFQHAAICIHDMNISFGSISSFFTAALLRRQCLGINIRLSRRCKRFKVLFIV